MGMQMDSNNMNPLQREKNVFIRTVTHYYTGKVLDFDEDAILLGDACWIACTKRFHDTLKNGEFEEVEPFVMPVYVNRAAVVDITEWTHALPDKQK